MEGRKIGEIRLLDTNEIKSFSTSTHTSSILLIIEFLKKCIDAEYFVIGIKVENSSFGEGISIEILDKVDNFIDLIVTQMSSFAYSIEDNSTLRSVATAKDG